MQGQYIFLNGNSYTKDGQKRSYATFADDKGQTISMNATAVQKEFPAAFTVCMCDFQVQQFAGGKAAFILENFTENGQLVLKK